MTRSWTLRLQNPQRFWLQTAWTKCGERTITWLGREVAGQIFAERFSHRFEGEAVWWLH